MLKNSIRPTYSTVPSPLRGGLGRGVRSTLLILLAFASPTAHAEPTTKLPAPLIAIVDVQRIMQESLAAQSTKKQLDTQRSKFQTEIEGEENELRQAEQTLAKERDKVPVQTYAEHEQQLRQRFSTVENHVQSRRKALDQAYADSMNNVRAALLTVVNKVAHEHGANMAIIKQQTLWIDPTMDITDEVLKRLDKSLPKVDVVMPKESETP